MSKITSEELDNILTDDGETSSPPHASSSFELIRCPCCGHGGDEVALTADTVIPNDGGRTYEIGYSVRCVWCGLMYHDEYQEAALAKWNAMALIVSVARDLVASGETANSKIYDAVKAWEAAHD